MLSASRQLCLSFFWLFIAASASAAQTQTNNKASATVQGRVLLESAPQAGLTVVLSAVPEGAAEMFTAKPGLTAVTDGDGRFRFAQVAAGKYVINVHAPMWFVDASGDDRLTIKEGDAIENYDINLKRGGVITGKVMDADGQPRIEEPIELALIDEAGQPKTFQLSKQPTLTDDRGVYRLFGLQPGQYRVSAGSAEQIAQLFNSEPEYQRTFYPGVTAEADAKLVTVRAGTDTENIDFKLVRADATEKKGFTVSGRIVNAETNQPVPGSMVMLMPSGDQTAAPNGGTPTMPANADGKGEFQFNNVVPGDYTAMLMNLQAMMTGNAAGYAEPLKIKVTQADVRGLEFRLKAGATLSGLVALDAKPNAPKPPPGESPLANLMVMATSERMSVAGDVNVATDTGAEIAGEMFGGGMALVKPDQTFTLSGLRPGKYVFRTQSLTGKKLQLLRLERNGATVPHIEVTGTEPIANVKLIFSAGTATLNGRVQVQGGTLPAGTHFSIALERQGGDDPAARMQFTESDKRGAFNLTGLSPGTYELKVTAVRAPNEAEFQYEFPAQTVILADNATQDVVLYVNLVKKENR
jgi:protocatechuate 3,4-dioxygenase beta subunit